MGEPVDVDAILKKARYGKQKKPRGDNRLGNIEDKTALDFAHEHGDSFRYVALWNRWMRFEEDRWQHEETLSAFDDARTLCREAGDAKAKTVAAVVTLARTDRAIAATEMQWDINKAIFNIPATEQQKR
jgi:putative DNA primase/helicase